jgi:hypothetical protein
MLRTFAVVLFIAPCLALDAEPTESGFLPFMAANSIPQILAQEQLFRKYADVSLGFQVASQFQALGSYEFQKFQKLNGKDEADMEEEEVQVPKSLEEEDSESDVSLLELKTEFYPGYGSGLGMTQPQSSLSLEELEHAGSFAKMSALKAMQIQFYMAASDVEKSYWANKLISTQLPPQLAMFKLYKSYLNTMALSSAIQFHDSFTFEAYIDDFNDRYGHATGQSSQLTEAMAEYNTYSQWHSLAMMKYQLFMVNMYEKMIVSSLMQQMPAQQFQSYLEVDAEPFFGGQDPSNYMAYQMSYLNYYGFFLKYQAISLELGIAQSGVSVAQAKYHAIQDDETSEAMSKYANNLEAVVLPQMLMQWGSVNQMKYSIEYYNLMLSFYAPNIAVAQAADRAENVFQNLVQTDAPVTTPETPAAVSITTPETPVVAAVPATPETH